jgi:acetoin utilization deacetylase AcuC-like enzyme
VEDNLKITLNENPQEKVGFAVAGDTLHRDPFSSSLEQCGRITSILRVLKEKTDLYNGLLKLNSRLITDSEILNLHTRSYLNKLLKMVSIACPLPTDDMPTTPRSLDISINKLAMEEFDSIFMTSKSVEAAKLSAGAALECVDAVLTGQVVSAAAAIRPPGHHAETHCAMGFCFFNNAALAAKRAVETHGLNRVLIVDLDIHHGNGTQRMFWNDEKVLYLSAHRWDKGKFYPNNCSESAPTAVGPRDGSAADGKTVNVAFYGGEMGDTEYVAMFNSVLLPIAREFAPELVIVSAGFDCCEGDPVGHYHVTPKCFGNMIYQLASPALGAKGKVVMLLEGGYNQKVTSQAFCECVQALYNQANDELVEIDDEFNEFTRWGEVKKSAVEAINATIQEQQPFWKSLKKVVVEDETDPKPAKGDS